MKNPHAVQGVGASGEVSTQHCTETQAPFPDAVSVFAPWAGPDDKPLRTRLHRAQTAATAKATRSKHGRARTIYWLAADIAGEKTFARTSVDDLKETLSALTRLFLTAGWIEQTEVSDDER